MRSGDADSFIEKGEYYPPFFCMAVEAKVRKVYSPHLGQVFTTSIIGDRFSGQLCSIALKLGLIYFSHSC